jgi:hypothetical protein
LSKTALFPAFCHKEASVTLDFGPFENIEERTSIFWTPAYLTLTAAPWIDRKNLHGNTQLHLAAFHDRCMAVTDLVERGASVEITNDHERTPLHTAVIQGSYRTALLLIDAGSNIPRQWSTCSIKSRILNNMEAGRKEAAIASRER